MSECTAKNLGDRASGWAVAPILLLAASAAIATLVSTTN
jgi:hypothetical protein